MYNNQVHLRKQMQSDSHHIIQGNDQWKEKITIFKRNEICQSIIIRRICDIRQEKTGANEEL